MKELKLPSAIRILKETEQKMASPARRPQYRIYLFAFRGRPFHCFKFCDMYSTDNGSEGVGYLICVNVLIINTDRSTCNFKRNSDDVYLLHKTKFTNIHQKLVITSTIS